MRPQRNQLHLQSRWPPIRCHIRQHEGRKHHKLLLDRISPSKIKSCTTITPTTTGPTVRSASGTTIQATHEATIPLSSILSKQAQTGHILDNLKTGSLISIRKLCDDDYVALFGKYNLKVFKNGQIIIRGTRNPSNGLWNIPLQTSLKNSSTPTNFACSAIYNDPLRQYLAGVYHGPVFSPLPSTFLRAINKGYFAT